MWCPSATLSVWANAWLAGCAAPDDVLDALSRWTPRQSVAAYDSVAAGSTGLPWPDTSNAGAASLLQLLRGSAGAWTLPTIRPVSPVPGDVRGLPAGTQFEREALAAGEAVIVIEPDGSSAVGLVPGGIDAAAALCWTVYTLPRMKVIDHPDLGDAEYSLRSAVRTAADTLASVGVNGADPGEGDPRVLVHQFMESSRQHRIPDHAPARAVRVLESAAHIDAVITVSAEVAAAPGHSASEIHRVADALRPLAAVVRSARTAAVDTILHSAWRG